ncbi:hypothetical protein KJ969_05755 [Patescibacteria group bacterium]|nr:hypothetical protein [Patescibacteria group bacterium]
MVIEKILRIPSKTSHGALRFRCPLCSRFNTAINPPTNLARCFHCETNFNPIDMVMAVKNTSFVQAVTLLNTYKNGLPHDQTKKDRPTHCLPPNASKLHRSDCKPVAINNILSSLMQKEQPHLAESDKTDSSSQSTPHHPTASLNCNRMFIGYPNKSINLKASLTIKNNQ